MPRFKGDHGIWIPIYLLVSSVIVAFTYPHFRSIWLQAQREFIIMAFGAVLLLLGVVGLEIISYEFLRVDASVLLYKLEVAIEEFLEMTGASLILYGTLRLMLSKRRHPILSSICD